MLISCKNHLTNGMQSKNGPASRFFIYWRAWINECIKNPQDCLHKHIPGV